MCPTAKARPPAPRPRRAGLRPRNRTCWTGRNWQSGRCALPRRFLCRSALDADKNSATAQRPDPARVTTETMLVTVAPSTALQPLLAVLCGSA